MKESDKKKIGEAYLRLHSHNENEGMTNEEAIKIIKQFRDRQGNSSDDNEAFDMAIKALEQQPCEDTEVIKVSKGAVKARQGRFVIYDVEFFKKNFYSTEEKIYGQPKQPSEDCISRQAVLERFDDFNKWCRDGRLQGSLFAVDVIKDMPSVTPTRPIEQQPKIGRWMRKTKVDGVYDIGGVKTWGVKCQCDRCDFTTTVIEDFGYYTYCPNCGAKMEVREVNTDEE